MIRGNVTFTASPNYKPFAAKRPITCVVIHATATNGINSPHEWLCDPASQVSAHYLIGKDGLVFQLVDENNEAWHAGPSEWRGQNFVNLFSVGIELVNSNDGIDPWPAAQVDACLDLVAQICKDNSIQPQDVIGHKDIAPGRKTDPVGFPFDDFRILLSDKLKAV